MNISSCSFISVLGKKKKKKMNDVGLISSCICVDGRI